MSIEKHKDRYGFKPDFKPILRSREIENIFFRAWARQSWVALCGQICFLKFFGLSANISNTFMVLPQLTLMP
ncbi:hypothetical protein HI914_03127 [Erysiphe necator]|nr:hypothetical protein HI914_03127 [Erysiphe necator]